MELRTATPEQLRMVFRRDMLTAFPEAELKPLAAMERLWAEGWYRPYCLFDGDEIVGEAFLWLGHPGWAIVDYLCVSAGRRNDGLGGEILRLLQQAEPGTVLFGEAEAPEHAPDPVMAQRRLGFYARCGLRTAGYDTAMFGVHYKTIVWSNGDVDEDEVLRRHQTIYRRWFTPGMYEAAIQIPLHEGEEPKVFSEWIEDREV